MTKLFDGETRRKTLRIVTLVCFFNFSGLNNGFTYLVVSSAGVHKIDITPLLVQQSAQILNPLNWKAFVVKAVSSRLNRSVRVIEFASQRTVKNFLIGAALAQDWAMASTAKILKHSSAQSSHNIAGRNGLETVQADRQTVLDSSSKRALEPPAVRALGGSRLRAEEPHGYIKQDRRSTWLMDRHHFWNGHKDVGRFMPQVCLDLYGFIETGGDFRLRLKRFIRVMPGKLRLWLSSSLSSRGDGDLASLHAIGLRQTPQVSFTRGFSFGGMA